MQASGSTAGFGGGDDVVFMPCGGGTGVPSPFIWVSWLSPFVSGRGPRVTGGLDGILAAGSSGSMSIGVEGSLGGDMAERLRSRSWGGRFRGCVSAE